MSFEHVKSNEAVRQIAEAVFRKYHEHYKGEVQGCCMLIADEIRQQVRGLELVAGYLTWYGGACRRSHWWLRRGEMIIDPMGDDFLKGEQCPGRQMVHRDADVIFESILPRYEQYRVPK